MLVSALRSKICEFREANGGGEGRVGIYRRARGPHGERESSRLLPPNLMLLFAANVNVRRINGIRFGVGDHEELISGRIP